MQFNSDISQLARQLMDFPVTQYGSNLLIPLSASSEIHFSNKKKIYMAGGKMKLYLLRAYGVLSRGFCH